MLALGNKKDLSSIQAFSTIIQALTKNSKYTNILGKEKETKARSQQWLEYITVCANHADFSLNAKRVLNVI